MPEKKTLKLEIYNVDEKVLKHFWRDTVRGGKRLGLGDNVPEVDIIKIDAEVLEHYPNVYAELIASISSCHLAEVTANFMKPKPAPEVQG